MIKTNKLALSLLLALVLVTITFVTGMILTGCQGTPEIKLSFSSAKNGIKTYDLLELGFDFKKEVKNPYDPSEISMDALVTLPDGAVQKVPMFWYEGYSRSLNGEQERLAPDGRNYWLLRYTPRSSGKHSIRVEICEKGKKSVTANLFETEVMPGNADAFLKVAADKEHLEFSNGRPFIGIGNNLCGWEWAGTDNQAGTFEYDRWLTELSRSGANMAQFDLCEGDNLEWSKQEGELPYSEDYAGVGRYNQQMAFKTDYKVNLCDNLGIFYRFSLYHWEDFDTETWNFPSWGWKRNPYNQANGGPAANVSEFFTKEAPKQATKNYMRYCVARWGYSTNLMLWELWNEGDADQIAWAEGSGYNKEEKNIADWHKEMAAYLKDIDVNKHLVTTSFAWYAYGDRIWKMNEIDVTTFHRYSMYNDAGQGRFNGIQVLQDIISSRLFQYQKPVIAGEFAVSPGGDYQRENDPDGIGFHNQIWSSVFAGSLGTAMHWTWGSYIDRLDQYHHYNVLSELVKYENLAGTSRTQNVSKENDPILYMTMTTANKNRGFAWVKDRKYDYGPVVEEGYEPITMSKVSVSIPNLNNGNYTAFLYDTFDRRIPAVSFDVEVTNGSAVINLPDFKKDIAVKLMLSSDVYLAADLENKGNNQSSVQNGDTLRLYSLGSDIGALADSGRFAYRKISGDFDYSMRVTKVTNIGEGAISKAGIMIRKSLSSSSTMAFTALSGSGKAIAYTRDGSELNNSGFKEGSLGDYVKVERRGNKIKSYTSSDGKEYALILEQTFNSELGSELYIGVMANSGNLCGYNDAFFEDIRLERK